jgi:hypothetical protein
MVEIVIFFIGVFLYIAKSICNDILENRTEISLRS